MPTKNDGSLESLSVDASSVSVQPNPTTSGQAKGWDTEETTLESFRSVQDIIDSSIEQAFTLALEHGKRNMEPKKNY